MTHKQYKALKSKAIKYAKNEELKFVRYSFGFITYQIKVPVLIFERGCQVQLNPKGIVVVDVWKREKG